MLLVQNIKRVHHAGIVYVVLAVNGEHAGGIANAEHLLTRQLPVHIARKRRDERNVLHMRLVV